jgi:hypothetical protein
MAEQLEAIHHGFIEAITSQNDARARHYRYPLLAERERYIEYLLRRGTGVKYIRVTASYMERIVEVIDLAPAKRIPSRPDVMRRGSEDDEVEARAVHA